uniref:Alpha-2-HS-glycoprotein 2 n=1 Tax=Nothobranchius furzeri TaxID=105023 RepID=A0A8C6P600_NOTFU
MNFVGITVALGLLGGICAQINVLRPECDSPEVEEAALVAQDYLNAQHNHGYKYVLNRIEDIKIHPTVRLPEQHTFVLEIDLLETDCHVLDPTPLANCTVRPKHLTAVEGDCDVVLKKVGGILTVTAFKCKTEEDLCLGCYSLLPLNHTAGLDFVQVSLTKLNNITENVTYALVEVGRMSAQVGLSQFVVAEANCVNDTCTALNDTTAARGICTAEGVNDPIVNCKMFSTLVMTVPLVDANSTAPVRPALPSHGGGLSHKHGHRHHKLTALHNPHLSSFLSAESAESAEVVPVAPALNVSSTPAAPTQTTEDSSSASDASASAEVPITVVKRDVPVSVAASAPADKTHPVVPVQVCPGRIRFF